MNTRRMTLIAALLVAAAVFVAAPTASAIAIQWSPEKPRETEEVRFTVTGLPSNATNVSYAWDFGDGFGSDEAAPIHVYSSAFNFVIQLDATWVNEGGQPQSQMIHAEVEVLLKPPAQFPPWLYWLMPLVLGLILISIATIVLVRGQPVIYNRVFFLLYAASGIKGLTEAGFYFVAYQLDGSVEKLFPWLDAGRAVGFLYPHFFVWFVLVFPRPLRPWLKTGWSGAVVLLMSLPFFVLQFVIHADGVVTRNLFNGYVSLLAFVSLGLLVYHAWETDSHEERHRIRLLAVTFFLLVFSTILLTGFQLMGLEELALASGLVLVPGLELVGCLLLMYAILRYQLLGVDLFLKRFTRAATFALSIGAVFVVVSNSIEQLFESFILGGIKFGFIVAGFISTALMYPVQKAAERFANRLFPQATNTTPDHLSSRRMEIYEAQLRYAMLDGNLKEKELSMLHALRDSLGLLPHELQRVATQFPGVNVGLLLPSKTSRAS